MVTLLPLGALGGAAVELPDSLGSGARVLCTTNGHPSSRSCCFFDRLPRSRIVLVVLYTTKGHPSSRSCCFFVLLSRHRIVLVDCS